MDPLMNNSVINFIDEVNKQRSLDESINKINDDPVVKLRRLNETKQQGVNACMNSILAKICKDAVPEVNGRVASTPDLDKVVADYVSRRTGGKDLEFYVKEAIRRNPKNTSVIKNVFESVERIVREQYTDKSLNPDTITEDDYKFEITPEIDDKLVAVIRDNNLDDLAEVIKDNVRETAISEVELAKKEKEERLALEEELTNDESITTEAALEEALRERGIGKTTSIYTPSLFEAVMVNKFNSMNMTESVITDVTYEAGYVTEGVIDKLKNAFKAKAEADAKETIAKNHSNFLANIEEWYKTVYSDYRSKISPVDFKKLAKTAKEILADPHVDNITVNGPILSDVKDASVSYKDNMKNLMNEKKYVAFSVPTSKKSYPAKDAIDEMMKAVAALDSYFEKPDVKSYVNKASAYISAKANKCENPKDVKTVYELGVQYYLADLAYYMVAITFVDSVVSAMKQMIKTYEKVAVKEAAFDAAVTEYTLLSLSKALYLESFKLADIDSLAKEYAMN